MAREGPEATPALVLVVDDEVSIVRFLRAGLESQGYRLAEASNGQEAIAQAAMRTPDLVLLDLGLPDIDGFEVVRRIREWSRVPIIVLSARDREGDKIRALDAGADDYVTKPFSVRELVSRVRANLRRTRPVAAQGSDEILTGGRVSMDVARHEVRVRGEVVELPPKEFELLEVLLRRKGRLLTRDVLIEEVWGPSYYGDTRTLDVHVKRLRRKIEEDPHHPVHLVTVRGLGYKFAD
jgi:two-component system response regulator RegX3